MFEPTSMCGVSAFIEKTPQRTKHVLHMHVLRTHGNQHQARGLPVAWNCVLASTAATHPNCCVFAYTPTMLYVHKQARKSHFKRNKEEGLDRVWRGSSQTALCPADSSVGRQILWLGDARQSCLRFHRATGASTLSLRLLFSVFAVCARTWTGKCF